MEVLFTLLAERYERGSVLLTSNLPFSGWEAIFKDPMTTAAAIDRLVHLSVIIELTCRATARSRPRRPSRLVRPTRVNRPIDRESQAVRKAARRREGPGWIF